MENFKPVYISAIIITILLIVSIFCSAFAMDLSEVKQYMNKEVIIYYSVGDNLYNIEGKLIDIVELQQDHTFDSGYSYAVIQVNKIVKRTIKITRIEKIVIVGE